MFSNNTLSIIKQEGNKLFLMARAWRCWACGGEVVKMKLVNG
jgi:hypothetical protein